ncbi:hypothetical protein PT2222_10410 [Paraburkholderia tropica]
MTTFLPRRHSLILVRCHYMGCFRLTILLFAFAQGYWSYSGITVVCSDMAFNWLVVRYR